MSVITTIWICYLGNSEGRVVWDNGDTHIIFKNEGALCLLFLNQRSYRGFGEFQGLMNISDEYISKTLKEWLRKFNGKAGHRALNASETSFGINQGGFSILNQFFFYYLLHGIIISQIFSFSFRNRNGGGCWLSYLF